MTPAEESAYLRALADEIAADDRYRPIARLIFAAILDGRATRIDRDGYP